MKKRNVFYLFTILFALLMSLNVSATTTPVAGSNLANSSPYNLSHYLQVKLGNGSYKKGSATLIAPNLLLTATHCISDGGLPESTVFAQSLWGNGQANYTYMSDISRTNSMNPFIIYKNYGGNWDAPNDIALVRITDPAQKTSSLDTSSVKLRVYRNISDLRNKNFTIVSNSFNLDGRWAYENGKITNVRQDGLLETNISGVAGQSGSAIIVDGQIIGIATSADSQSHIVITPFTENMKTTLFEANGFTNIEMK
ncbi:trypsin-like serine protease [Streptococcus iniae]|uniref:trypsin-like serine peptidase n=1 Tax=Streptococcus iniae TaxID=1346 RepID=UPI002B280A84|nr:trypsin-like serine protease [Streptococcus iniae]WNZ94601.1 trypsin-like serine protease [Streptococcus iniae]WNZ97577.1 trypsin-like serine protease [Streptococcus iniae]